MPSPSGTFLESPLHYDLEGYPFLRIEGHLDQELVKARAAVEKLIKDFNLPIQVEAIHLDAGGPLVDKNCGWHDLQEEYSQHRYQLLGIMRDLKEILSFLREMNKKYGEKDELFEKEVEEHVMKYFELFETWIGALEECLEDLNWNEFQEGYKKILQTLLDVLLIQMKFLDKIDLPEKDSEKNLELYNGLLTRVSPIVYRILDLFYFTKIQRLYLSYLHRVSKLQNSRKFSEYLKQNPGLVHEAGVYRGGTFFLLYLQSTGKVIGDFSLPGSACDCECIDACGDEKWDLLPPFARPDYAITLQNTPIRIEVMVNDRLPVERKYVVKPTSDTSEKGGEVKQDGNTHAFFYNPSKDFSGDDAFTYLLIDENSGLQDEGRVTIWVKAPKAKTCYTADILNCWGEKNVLSALRGRGIDPGNQTFAQNVQSLLSSLGQTKGFTLEEIESTFLEDEETRRQLLSCAGVDTSNSDYQTLQQQILEYQKSNCGSVLVEEPVTPTQPDTPTPVANCTSRRVVGIIRDVTGKVLANASIQVQGTNLGTLSGQNGAFDISFPTPGVTLLINMPEYLPATRTICSETSVIIELTPRSIGGAVVVSVSPNSISNEAIIEILGNKGITVNSTASTNRNDLIKLATGDKPEISLSENELSGLKNDTLRIIATTNNVNVRSTDSKSTLINKLIGN